jgi:hypothetical protein
MYQRKDNASVKFWRLTNWQMWVFGLILPILVLAYGYKWYRNYQASLELQSLKIAESINSAQNGSLSPVLLQDKLSQIKRKYPNASNQVMKQKALISQQIAVSLGTDSFNYSPLFGVSWLPNTYTSFTEDTTKVVKLLKQCPTTYVIIEDLYYLLHTRSRNLTTDLITYLNQNEINEVKATYAKYGKKFLT